MLSLDFRIVLDALHDFASLFSDDTQLTLLRPAETLLELCVHGPYSLACSINGKAIRLGASDVDLVPEVRDERDRDLAVTRETM